MVHQDGEFVYIGRPRFRWSWALHGSFVASTALLGGFMAVLLSLPQEADRTFLDARPVSLYRVSFDFAPRKLAAAEPLPDWVRPEPRGRAHGFALAKSGRQAHLARAFEAKAAGILGILRGDSRSASIFGHDSALGADAENVLGNLVGNEIGEAYGIGGLGVTGTGRGGGGNGVGRSEMGKMGKMGKHGGGSGLLGGRRARGGGEATLAAPAAPVTLAMPVLERPAALPAIDPNGRFATTYRPGHGRLSWLDAALARGNLPEVPEVLVGDLTGGAAPRQRAPRERALSTDTAFERGALSPSGGPVHLRIVLRSTDLEARRAPLGVHVALDVSGSMAGRPLQNAVQAVRALVARLHDGDEFSLTTFSEGGRLVVPAGAVGPRRTLIESQLGLIRSESGTNIEAGLLTAFAQARQDARVPERISLVMLLSDGHPNVGETRPEALARLTLAAFQGGVQTSAFGLGDSYDDRLMSGVADAGAGGYYYLRSSDAITGALTAELEQRLQPVAQAVELRVRLAHDVRLVRTYGARRLDESETAVVRTQEVAVDHQVARRDGIVRDRQHDSAGGMRFFIPAFARDDQHVMLLGLELPPGAAERTVATLELRYKDRVHGRNVAAEQVLKLGHADSDRASFATLDRSVQETIQTFAAGQALVDAAAALRDGNRGRASALLGERIALLKAAAPGAHRRALERQAARLQRFQELIGAPGLGEPLTLALLLGNTGRELLR